MSSKCHLCKKEADLANSHIIPKFLYRYMRKHQDKINNINGLLVTNSQGDKLDVTQRQWRKQLFCHECETLLSKNETRMSKIFHEINSMNKKDRENIFHMTNLEKIDKESFKKNFFSKKGYQINDAEIDEVILESYLTKEKKDTLKYFCISYILRQLYIIENNLSERIIEKFEQYILSNQELKLKTILKINTGNESKIVASSICLDNLEKHKHYNFIIPEIWFHLIIDIEDDFATEQFIVIPEDFFKDEHVFPLLSSLFKGVGLTDKAKQAFSKQQI